MFGKRSGTEGDTRAAKPAAGVSYPPAAAPAAVSREAAPPVVSSPPISPAKSAPPAPVIDARRSDTYYQVKATIFGALIEAIGGFSIALANSLALISGRFGTPT